MHTILLALALQSRQTDEPGVLHTMLNSHPVIFMTTVILGAGVLIVTGTKLIQQRRLRDQNAKLTSFDRDHVLLDQNKIENSWNALQHSTH